MYKKKGVLWLLLVGIIVLAGCEYTEQASVSPDTITSFEDLNLEDLGKGTELTIKGEAFSKGIKRNPSGDELYTFHDKDGFSVQVEARGGRYLELGQTYTIKGVVNNYVGSLSKKTFWYIEEVKP